MRAATTRDEWLALRCQLGDREAFEELVREMERPLLYYATKLLKDEARAFDVLQEVWITVLGNIRRLESPSSLRPWLYRITYGRAVDSMRRDLSRQRAEQIRAESFSETDQPSSFAAEDAATIHWALDALELKFREVLVLRFLEDFSVSEIAFILGCPEGTAKSRIHYATRAIRELLVRSGYER